MNLKNNTLNIKVLIPLYKDILSDLEVKIIENNIEQLKDFEIIFLLPTSLSTKNFSAQIELKNHTIIRVSDEWLGRKNGISGYNNMLLSKGFYELFTDVKYILICHSDAYIFKNQLSYWYEKDYDCIAAPWVKRSVYQFPLISCYMWIRRKLFSRYLHHLKQDLYNKIGNGGLSLRKVSSFITACDKYSNEIDFFLSQKGHLYHEDVFWAIIPSEFSYPTTEEAMQFSIDTNPKYCYKKLGGELPFGCHGLTRKRLFNFWKDIIGLQSNS